MTPGAPSTLPGPTDRVLVAVPVHITGPSGTADVARCLASVQAHRGALATPFDLLVIDDASPTGDVEAVVAALPTTPDTPIEVRRHEENRGFVATANEAFAAHAGDVVLLNSDTVVTAGWLDGLVEAAASAPEVATVTPLTNDGSICSLPPHLRRWFDLDGAAPRIDDCARLVREGSLRLRPAVISGVGFCLLVRRAALDRCGPFDEEEFGRGYGEEVDFCLRATAHGFRHLVDDATFVYHRGGGSFGPGRHEAKAEASARLHRCHPGFKAANRAERANDPLAPVFANLEAVHAPRDPERPHVLHLLHAPSPNGGTELHLSALTTALAGELDASTLMPSELGVLLHSRWRSPDGTDHEAIRLLPDPTHDQDGAHGAAAGQAAEAEAEAGAPPASALRTALDLLPTDAVHVHNLIGHPLETLAELADFPGPVLCSVHDLYLACPNHSLLYQGRSSCGLPEDLDVCARCLPVTRDLDVEDLRRHRATVTAGLDAVDRWIAFSRASADHLQRAYPIEDDRIELVPHGALIAHPPPPLDERHLLEDPLEVAFVGRAWAKKGLSLVNRAAEELAGVASIRFHHFGDVLEPLADPVRGHGSYEHHQLPDLLRQHGIGVVLIPGPYAETYGFVMSEALQAGVPVVGPYYGAVAERIRAHDVGWTIDPDEDGGLARLLAALDACRLEVLRAAAATRTVHAQEVAVTARRYLALYRPGHPPQADADDPIDHPTHRTGDGPPRD